MKANRLMGGVVVLVAFSSAGLVGCGGGSDVPNSYADVVAEMKSPTGTVDATSVKAIGPEFEKSQSSGLGAVREDVAAKAQAASASYDVPCTGGGKITATAEGDQSNAKVTSNYANCCEADCCLNGTGVTYVSAAADAEYSGCFAYDISSVCGTNTASLKFQGCLNGALGFTYLITIGTDSYAVSGSYSGGNGELTITGANGTFTCTYTSGAGTCTGDGQITF